MKAVYVKSSSYCLMNVLLLIIVQLIIVASSVQGDGLYTKPSVAAAEILRRRGYTADEFFVETSSGYVLRLTRGRNPLIEGGRLKSKDPILFLHGSFNSANDFLINSLEAEPKDFTNISLSETDLDTLIAKLADEPSAKSLCLLALNFGHECWLLDRRGVPGSQQLIGDPLSIKAKPSASQSSSSMLNSLTSYLGSLVTGPSFARQVVFSLDQKFWNYSLDEQTQDFREVIDYILDRTPSVSRVSVVGHSAGGAITLMALSLYPNELTQKISSCVLWSPIYATGNNNTQFLVTFSPVVPVLESFIGPVPAPFLANPVQASLMVLCSSPLTWTSVCESFLDLLFGKSGGQQPAKPYVFASEFFAASSHEVAQIGQTATRYTQKTMHAYNYGAARNQVVYGQSTPSAYDLSVVRNFSSLSFYSAGTDSLVTPSDVLQSRAQLTVPSQYQEIKAPFNHIGYFSHKDAARLVIIPSMRDLETLAQ